MRRESMQTLQRRLAAWVREARSGRRYAALAAANIEALRAAIRARA